MEDLPISEYIAQIRKAQANFPNMTKEEKLNKLREFIREFTRIKYRLIFKQKKREVEQKFKEPGKRPLEKKVVRLAHYRRMKVLFQRKLEEFPHIPDNQEWFRRFCRFRINWLRAEGRRKATLKYLGLLEKKTS